MNIVTTLRPNTPFPKKAVQRYDKKIKKLVLDGRNIFSLLCEICFLFFEEASSWIFSCGVFPFSFGVLQLLHLFGGKSARCRDGMGVHPFLFQYPGHLQRFGLSTFRPSFL